MNEEDGQETTGVPREGNRVGLPVGVGGRGTRGTVR